MAFMKSTQPRNHFIGAEISSERVRLVRIRRQDTESPKILAAHTIPLTEAQRDDPKTFSQALRVGLKTLGSEAKDVFWAVCSPSTLTVKPIKLPELEASEQENAAFWTFKKNHPIHRQTHCFGYDLHSPGMDNRALNTWAFALEREQLNPLVLGFEAAGGGLQGITFPQFSIRNLITHAQVQEAKHAQAFIWLDVEQAHLVLFHQEKLVSHTSLHTGIRYFQESLRKNFPELNSAQSVQDAWEAFIDPTSATSSLPKHRLKSIQETLFVELEKLQGFLLQTIARMPTDHLYLLGDLATCTPLVEHLGQSLGIRVSTLPFNSERGEKYSGAYALALSAALSEERGVNALKTPYDVQQRAIRMNLSKRVVGAAAVLAAGALVFAGWAEAGYQGVQRALQQTQGQHQALEVNADELPLLVSAYNQELRNLHALAERKESIALLNDLIRPTREQLKVLSLDAVLSPRTKETEPLISLELLLGGESHRLQSELTAYAATLENSPLIERVELLEVKPAGVEASPQLYAKLAVYPILEKVVREKARIAQQKAK